MASTRRIKVKGIKRDEIDTEQLALIYWLQAKRVLREKREREAAEKAKRQGAQAMNGELPTLIAIGGAGSAMLAGIGVHEHARAQRMRASRVRLSTRYPVGLEATQVAAVWNGLAGLPYTTELVTEVVATEDKITHSLLVPEAACESVRAALTGAVPSMRITDADAGPSVAATLTLRLFVQTPSFLLTDDAASVSRSLLSGLAHLRRGEVVALRWALSPGSPHPRREPAEPTPRQKEITKAWTAKIATPGFRVSGLVSIRAGSRVRAREIASHIESVLRSRRGFAGGIRGTYERGSRALAALPKVNRSSGWLGVSEIVPLLGLPLGEPVPGVEVGASRELLVPRHVSREGRRLFMGRDSNGERPVALSPEAASHHVAIVGPSGVGKSVLLANSILSDIRAGRGGVLIDPKDDLIDLILDQIASESPEAERIVVLDAGDDSRPIAGLDVLRGGDLDARADTLIRTFKAMFPEWGIRSENFGRLGIRTLSETPGATLMDLGRLFADEGYRRAAVANLSDGFLRQSWAQYESLSPAAKVDVVQAPLARVAALLSRPRVRAVVASAEPKIDVAQLLAEKRFLLVSLAPGVLGEAAPLIGSAVMAATWSAIEARVAISPERRHLVSVYIDELATVVNGLPSDIELVAERARGLGASLTVALQTLGRVPEPTRSALLGNLATLISFRAGATEATAIARELPGFTASDLQALGAYEVCARVGTGGGSAVSVVTGRTEPLPPVIGQAGVIRDRSAARYGSTPSEPTASPTNTPDDGDLVGSRRRQR